LYEGSLLSERREGWGKARGKGLVSEARSSSVSVAWPPISREIIDILDKSVSVCRFHHAIFYFKKRPKKKYENGVLKPASETAPWQKLKISAYPLSLTATYVCPRFEEITRDDNAK
jgi:hypothetical protein